MAKTYAQLAKEIEALTAKAEAARKREAAGVIARVKEAIEVYGLTAEDLGFGANGSGPAKPGRRAVAKVAKKSAATKTKLAAKYRDDAGNSWTGRGSRPRWLSAALAAGQPLEAFMVGDAATASAKGKPRKAKKTKPAAKYRDDAGHSWSGRGPQPRWLKEAIAGGKTLEEMAA